MAAITRSQINNIAQHPLQTWEWGEFRKATGNEVLRTKYGQMTLHRIPKTNYKLGIFLKGPEPTETMLRDLQQIGQEHNLIFIKLEPAIGFTRDSNLEHEPVQEGLVELLKNNGAVLGKPFFTPTTFWIDLTKSEEELLKSFHSKTRYNIRYAERQGVKVVEDNSPEAFDTYIKLKRETVERQKFYDHTETYHRLMWGHLHPAGIAKLLTAKYKGEILVAWVMFQWKDTLYYPYGASTDRHKNAQAASLMMWEAIRFGKKQKLKTFDLWGREQGKGFTKFKEGYNPTVVEFLGSWDLITSSQTKYRAYRLAETARWQMLRLKSQFTKPTF